MSSPPPPKFTPQPYTSDRAVEPTTNPGLKLTPEQIESLRAVAPAQHIDAFLATPEYVKTKQAESKTEITRYVASADVKWFAASMAAVAVAAVVLVGWFDARAAEKDAGVARVAADALEEHKKAEAERMARLEARVEQVRVETAQAARDQGQKLDAMLFRFGVPNPAPTPATDGGR